MQTEYTESYFAQAGEVNAEREVSLPVLVTKMIDIATHHANSLGIGNPAMTHLGGGWVLSRLVIEMDRYPKANEEYSLTTWVEGWNRHFSERSFAVVDSAGQTVGYARSIWMVLDMNTHESMGLTHLIPPECMLSDRRAPIARIGRHRILEPSISDRKHMFRYCDLDYYRHVNTVRYIELLLNQFSLQEMDSSMIRRIELCFMHEGPYGEAVDVRCESHDLISEFTIARADSTPILTASTLRIER